MTINHTQIPHTEINYSASQPNQCNLERHLHYRLLQGKVAFLRYKIDKEELKNLKKLGIEKYLDEIIATGNLDKTSLQCLTKLRSREKRLEDYPKIFGRIWERDEVQELKSVPHHEAEMHAQKYQKEIQKLDQLLDSQFVRRSVQKIEGKRSISFSDKIQVQEYQPERGNYQWVKLRTKKIENLPDSRDKLAKLKQLLSEMNENYSHELLQNEPGYKSLYLKISGLIESCSRERLTPPRADPPAVEN